MLNGVTRGEIDFVFSILLFSYGQDEGRSRVAQSFSDSSETQELLSHLLLSASILDAYTVIKSEGVSKATVQFLYAWMVETDMKSTVFEVFALALQRPGLGLDFVSLEPNFASRALCQYKKEHAISLSADCCIGYDTVDDEL